MKLNKEQLEQIEAMQLELQEVHDEITGLSLIQSLEFGLNTHLEKEIYFLKHELNKYKTNFWVKLFGIKY